MRTDELVQMLATGHEPVDARAPARRLAVAAALGALVAAALMLAFLGVRPDISRVASLPMFWIKLGFVVGLAAFALPVTLRLGRPGARLGRLPWGLAAPVAVVWLLAAVAVWTAAPDERASLILGGTWASCVPTIAALSIPPFAFALRALRGLAPTRLRLAGAAAGLLAGSIGASAYALHCPELAAPFLALWYLAGVLLPAAVGAWIGPRALAW